MKWEWEQGQSAATISFLKEQKLTQGKGDLKNRCFMSILDEENNPFK